MSLNVLQIGTLSVYTGSLLALLLALRVPTQNVASPSIPAPAPTQQTEAQTPAPASYEIAGTARSGKTPLPGSTVTASHTLTGKNILPSLTPRKNFLFDTSRAAAMFCESNSWASLFSPRKSSLILKTFPGKSPQN